LWRAVDQDGYALDEIVQARRDTKAAKRLLTRLLKKQGCWPKRIVTDKLRSYAAAKRTIMPDVEHRSHKGLNNRAENSHVPIRKRKPMMQGFRSWSGLQHFVPVFSTVRKPLRSTPITPLSLRHPLTPPGRDSGMEIRRGRSCLKSSIADERQPFKVIMTTPFRVQLRPQNYDPRRTRSAAASSSAKPRAERKTAVWFEAGDP
jgi:putative transposase